MSATVKKLAELIGLFGVLVAIILWTTDRFEGKASVARAEAIESRLRTVELDRVADRTEITWMKTTLFAIAQRVGAVVAAPPNP